MLSVKKKLNKENFKQSGIVKSLALIAVLGTFVSACSNDDSVGEINGKEISNESFDAYLKFKRIKIRDDKHREEHIKQYMDREALALSTEHSDVLDAALVQAELDEFRQQMYVSRYFEKFLKEAVSDQAIQNYYVVNAKDYEHRKAHIAHVLFRTTRDMGDNEKGAKKTAAHEVYSKLKAGGDFRKLATDYSEDKNSAGKGGDLGWMKEGAINSVLSDKAFSLEKGEYTEPFETPFGYHVLMLLDDYKAVKQPLETVKGAIKYKLRQQAKQAEIERLNESIDIEIY